MKMLRAPERANAMAIALPSPRPAPVTTVTLPVRAPLAVGCLDVLPLTRAPPNPADGQRRERIRAAAANDPRNLCESNCAAVELARPFDWSNQIESGG
jgi:hypothetical protein